MKYLPLKLDEKLAEKTTINVFPSLLMLLTALFISSCASNRAAGELSEVTVLAQGKSINQEPRMMSACKGFYITPEKLKSFFQHAASTHEQQASSNYAKLPCYSSGTAYLGNEEIQWILRAGGIGEFYHQQPSLPGSQPEDPENSSDRKAKTSFTKICGVSCCNKVQGVC